jgi:hypothetical protein
MKGKRYRSKRAVASNSKRGQLKNFHIPMEWTGVKVAWLCFGTLILAILMLAPILFFLPSLEYADADADADTNTNTTVNAPVVGLHGLLQQSKFLRKRWTTLIRAEEDYYFKSHNHNNNEVLSSLPIMLPPKETLPPIQATDLGRGVAGLPIEQTHALLGAMRASLECPITDKDSNTSNTTTVYNNTAMTNSNNKMVYWNQPQGLRDREFLTPFRHRSKETFLTFEPDPGGWNNIRMRYVGLHA